MKSILEILIIGITVFLLQIFVNKNTIKEALIASISVMFAFFIFKVIKLILAEKEKK